MQERIDGSFSETKPYSDFMKLFEDEAEMANTKAIHFGTHEELNKIRNKKSFEDRLTSLEEKMEEKQQNSSEYFVFPTDEEIKKYGSKGPMEKNMLRIMSGIAQK